MLSYTVTKTQWDIRSFKCGWLSVRDNEFLLPLQQPVHFKPQDSLDKSWNNCSRIWCKLRYFSPFAKGHQTLQQSVLQQHTANTSLERVFRAQTPKSSPKFPTTAMNFWLFLNKVKKLKPRAKHVASQTWNWHDFFFLLMRNCGFTSSN